MTRANAVLDGAVIFAFIVIFASIFIFLTPMITDINTEIQADADIGATAKQISQNNISSWSIWDGVIMFIFVCMWGVSLVLSRDIGSQPVFFVFSIIGITVLLLSVFAVAEYMEDTLSDADYIGFKTAFPMSYWLVSNLIIVVIIVSFSIAAIMHTST